MKDDEPLNLGATVVVISKDLKALIVQRHKGKTFEGMWGLPGGKMDESDGIIIETGFRYFPSEHNAIRELREETGIVVDRSHLTFLHSFIIDKRLLLCFFTYINKVAEEIPIALTECAAYKWVGKSELQEYAFIPDASGDVFAAITKIEDNI